ncbi:hypothetical protein Ccrd_013848 [Cynara cardunculus var. scolymus]|uniref:Uncharacterized protein n=1 Tax=Cynara cardunculus var. scolymus TaxID=59895 RepID=A0A103YET2_CYNCS|nr:hypothetical protein Ccrd_013848 [Cynara cardunculus var. scolymus]
MNSTWVLTTWAGDFQSLETYVIKGLIVKDHTFVCVFNQLVHRECGVIGLNNGFRDLWRRENGECKHHPIRRITILSLLTYNIKNGINQLRPFSVMPLSPITASTGLTEHKIIRPKDMAIGTTFDTIHGTRLKIHEDCTRDVSATGCLIVINIYSFTLDIS